MKIVHVFSVRSLRDLKGLKVPPGVRVFIHKNEHALHLALEAGVVLAMHEGVELAKGLGEVLIGAALGHFLVIIAGSLGSMED